jgi:hypothetical protein
MDAKRKSKSIDDNWVLVGKPNILTPPRARADPKPRTVHTVEPDPDPPTAILEGMKRLETNFLQTTNVLQNRIVQMERNQ